MLFQKQFFLLMSQGKASMALNSYFQTRLKFLENKTKKKKKKMERIMECQRKGKLFTTWFNSDMLQENSVRLNPRAISLENRLFTALDVALFLFAHCKQGLIFYYMYYNRRNSCLMVGATFIYLVVVCLLLSIKWNSVNSWLYGNGPFQHQTRWCRVCVFLRWVVEMGYGNPILEFKP